MFNMRSPIVQQTFGYPNGYPNYSQNMTMGYAQNTYPNNVYQPMQYGYNQPQMQQYGYGYNTGNYNGQNLAYGYNQPQMQQYGYGYNTGNGLYNNMQNMYGYNQPMQYGYGYNTAMNGYYGNNIGFGTNAYLLAQKKAEYEKQEQARLKVELSVMANISVGAKKVSGLEFDEEKIREYYTLEKYYERMNPQPKIYDTKHHTNFRVTVLDANGNEIWKTPDREGIEMTQYEISRKIENERVCKSIGLQLLAGFPIPGPSTRYIQIVNAIKAQHDKMVDPKSDLVDFFKNAYKLYIDALEEDARHQRAQLDKYYDKERFRKELYRQEQYNFAKIINGTVNVDDDTIGLPEYLKRDNGYQEARERFYKAALQRG